MDWVNGLHDKLSGALVIVGLCAVVGAAGFLEVRLRPQRQRQWAHGIVCLGGCTVGVGALIAAVRESDRLRTEPVLVMALGLVVTTVVYLAFISRLSPWLGAAAGICAALTVLSGLVVIATYDNDECSPTPVDTAVVTTAGCGTGSTDP